MTTFCTFLYKNEPPLLCSVYSIVLVKSVTFWGAIIFYSTSTLLCKTQVKHTELYGCFHKYFWKHISVHLKYNTHVYVCLFSLKINTSIYQLCSDKCLYLDVFWTNVHTIKLNSALKDCIDVVLMLTNEIDVFVVIRM